jgi:hypothetical protein
MTLVSLKKREFKTTNIFEIDPLKRTLGLFFHKIHFFWVLC